VERRLIVVVLAAGCQRSGPAPPPPAPAAPVTELNHFPGVIGHDKQTYDTARSGLYVRAARALEAGDAAGAEALYREAVAKYPSDPDGYESLGACLLFQARYAEARAEYEGALRLAPQSRDALYGLGCVAYSEDRFRDAVGHLKAALAIRPADVLAHRALALAYDALGEGARAMDHYAQAAELDPRVAAEEHVRRRMDALKKEKEGPAPRDTQRRRRSP
jgi:Flp pilus assembly protein TadD